MNFDDKGKLAQLQQLVDDVLDEAKKHGASAAEVRAQSNLGLSATIRQGETETLEHTRDNSLSISVYFGKRKASATTAELSPEAIREAIDTVCAMAKYTAEDEFSGLPEKEMLATEFPDLELYHPSGLDIDQALELAYECEASATDYSDQITNSEGATFTTEESVGVYGNSLGFNQGYPTSRHGLSCSVIAGHGDQMQRDYWYSSARKLDEVESAQKVGQRCAKRTLARMNPQKLDTQKTAVLFSADVASGLLRILLSAIKGVAIYRKASFLLDALNTQLFPDWVMVTENPFIAGALGSASFDAEGVTTTNKKIIDRGILTTWLLSSYSARKLGLHSTGNAGGVRNLHIEMGGKNFDQLVRTMDKGLVVTELMGQGINSITGDYSRGAAGFWVENGQIQFPVQEITIAGNMKTMYQQLIAVGNDDDYSGSIRTGSWLIEEMMIAGT